MRGKDQLFPCLVNDISAFKIKLKLFIFQFEKKNLSQLPHLKEQSECVENIVNFAKYIKKIKLLQKAFDSCFSDFSEEKDCMLAFINPFSLNKHNILKIPSNMQMELIELKANSVSKVKFNEFSSFPSASKMIGFWRSLPCEHFPEMRKFVQRYVCLFGATYRYEQSFSSMKTIKNKLRSLIWFRFNKLAKIQTYTWFACFYQIRIFSSCSFLQAQSEKEKKRIILLHQRQIDLLFIDYSLGYALQVKSIILKSDNGC